MSVLRQLYNLVFKSKHLFDDGSLLNHYLPGDVIRYKKPYTSKRSGEHSIIGGHGFQTRAGRSQCPMGMDTICCGSGNRERSFNTANG